MKPTAEELLAEAQRVFGLVDWQRSGYATTGHSVLSALNAVLAISNRFPEYAISQYGFYFDEGFNQALAVVRAEIEGELR